MKLHGLIMMDDLLQPEERVLVRLMFMVLEYHHRNYR